MSGAGTTVEPEPAGEAGQAAVPPACDDKTVTYTTDSAGDVQSSGPTLPVDDRLLPAAVAESFCSPSWAASYPDGRQQQFSARPHLAPEEASCIGVGLVEELGADRVRQMPTLGTGPWSTLGFGLVENGTATPVKKAEAEAIADVFIRCTDQWKLLLALSVTEGADQIGDSSATCVNEELGDEDARTILISELDRAYDDPAQPDVTPFPDVIEPLITVFEQCLTSDEKAALDLS